MTQPQAVQLAFLKAQRRSIKTIAENVIDLFYQEDVFQKRIKPKIDSKFLDNHSASVIVGNHYSSALVAVRKQVNGKVSLLTLLRKLEVNNRLVTEKWYSVEWLKDSHLLAASNSSFEKDFVRGIPAGEFRQYFGKRGFLAKAVVQRDILTLTKSTKLIEKYVNKRLAHQDRAAPKLIKEQDYINALKVIDEVTKKYYLLLEQTGLSLKSVIQD